MLLNLKDSGTGELIVLLPELNTDGTIGYWEFARYKPNTKLITVFSDIAKSDNKYIKEKKST